MNDKALVSVIVPFYNTGAFIKEAILSITQQTHKFLEIIIVNDGSTDNTLDFVKEISDERIRYFEQKNQGVSVARNVGLSKMNGEYFCFLDADDQLPANSIEVRLNHFDNPDLAFVGGSQQQMNHDMSQKLSLQVPTYQGNPSKGLMKLDASCFVNCGTWLIKRDQERNYEFRTQWSHAEDLAFFLDISNQGKLKSIKDIAQYYRKSQGTAMTNLIGLLDGYLRFILLVKKHPSANWFDVWYLKLKVFKIMCLSFLKDKQYGNAFTLSSTVLLR